MLRDGGITGTAIATIAISALFIVYRQSTGKEPMVLMIPAPAVVTPELHLHRAQVDAPLHAIGAELRMGDQNNGED